MDKYEARSTCRPLIGTETRASREQKKGPPGGHSLKGKTEEKKPASHQVSAKRRRHPDCGCRRSLGERGEGRTVCHGEGMTCRKWGAA